MNPTRFQAAKRIYGEALERDPVQRDAYVNEACQGDDSLREEVESLLACRAEGEQFFVAPAIEAGAKALAREPPADLTGHTLSHYTVLEKIGEGGMGVVYRAHDTHLDRDVALKVLSPEKLLDPDRKRRFVLEAKAASALNHPNIVVIHDIDTFDDITFIAMEFIKGKTLDRIVRDSDITLNDTLEYGTQIAGALAAAHDSGIIHRDIKPANIMLTDSGVVKLLDFGLAKLTDRAESARDEIPQVSQEKTQAGIVLGTVAYMSPEQAEGKEVDARSDIFSVGSVLYEMISGRRAFAGETKVSTLTEILRDEPERLSQIVPGVPPDVEAVVERCLRKSPDLRFGRMSDLKATLEQIRQGSNFRAQATARTHRPSRAFVLFAFACLLLAVLVIAAWFGVLQRPAARPPALVKTFTALAGVETRPAFSPDGKQLAFAWNGHEQDNFDIYVQLVDEATPRRLTTNTALDYNPAWSPDALHIAFLRDTPSGSQVIVVPTGGGAERLLHTSRVRSPYDLPLCGLAWSPDGKFLAVADQESEQAPISIVLLDVETRESRRLTSPAIGSWDGLPSFSPDGRRLAFTRGHDRPLSDIYILPLSSEGQPDGELTRVTYDNTFIYGLNWTAEGRGLVFSSTRGGIWALWRVAAVGGEPERLPVGGNNAFWPTVSRLGNRLAYSEGVEDWNIWRVAAPGGGASGGADAAPLKISASPQLDEFPAFSPDGRMITWSSTHSGSHQIWISGSDGSKPIQLTHLGPPGAAKSLWSPDGRLIAFEGYGRGPRHVYVIGADGGPPRRLTSGDLDDDLDAWSRDSKWVYFDSTGSGGQALWKAPIDGGPPVRLVQDGWGPVESLDRKYVYYSGLDKNIWKLSMSGGSPVLVARNGWRPLESIDGKFVYYSGPEASIWKIPAIGGNPVRVLKTGPRASWTLGAFGMYVLDPDAKAGPSIQLFPFNSGRIKAVRLPGKPNGYGRDDLSASSLSPDGRFVLYVHVDRDESDIMMAENFR